jgi:hypothetical protein
MPHSPAYLGGRDEHEGPQQVAVHARGPSAVMQEGLTGVHLLWTFSIAESSRSDDGSPRCGYIRGHVVPTTPPPSS